MTPPVKPSDVLSVHVDNRVVHGRPAAVVRALHDRALFDQDADLGGYVTRVYARLASFGIRETATQDVEVRCAALLTALADLGICAIRVHPGARPN